MTDQTPTSTETTQTPNLAPIAVIPPGTQTTFWSKVWAKIDQDVKVIWQKDKLFFIAFFALIVVVKFRQGLINILIGSAKWIFDRTQEKDAKLQAEIKENNDKADKLVAEANSLPAQEKPVVDVDWYKNDK